MLFPVHLSLLAALLVTMTAMASHIPNQSRQHRNNLHRRVVRRVVRDCSGDATVSSAVSMSTRVPYSSTGAPRSTPPSSSTASPVSPYATVVALPDSANNVPFAQNADTNSTDVSFTLTDGANPDSNASASILGEVAETVNAIAQNVEYSYAVSTNGTDLEADLFLAGVYLASDYDTSLDGPEPETKRRGLSSRRRRAGVCNHGDWRCTDMDLERESLVHLFGSLADEQVVFGEPGRLFVLAQASTLSAPTLLPRQAVCGHGLSSPRLSRHRSRLPRL